jgi:hypothetical protein
VRTEARFPGADRKAGHYESFYIKACRPGGGLGVWIRHTVHKQPGAEPTASLWFTLFDSAAAGPQAAKLTVSADQLLVPDGAYIQIAGAVFEPSRAAGSFSAGGLDVSWDLALSGEEPPFHHLPRGWMYSGPLPRTKFLSPHPDAGFDGRVEVGGRELAVEGWRGMVGHNWGAQHAERWTWLHGAGFEEGDGWFDAALGRIKLGPLTTPWVGNGMLVLDGEHHRLGGIERTRKTTIEDQPTSCDFVLPGKDIEVRGRVASEPKNFVAWVYADPDGSEHNTLNCSIADLRLSVERPGQPARELEVRGAAAYEIGMRETDHGISLQPFPDG